MCGIVIVKPVQIHQGIRWSNGISLLTMLCDIQINMFEDLNILLAFTLFCLLSIHVQKPIFFTAAIAAAVVVVIVARDSLQ